MSLCLSTETHILLGIVTGYKLSEDQFDVSTYLTDPKYRGLGLGTKTWNAALEDMGPNCNISLIAEHGKESMYNKMGFGILGPKRDVFVGVPNRNALPGTLSDDVVIEELGKECLDDIRDYDLETSGVDRFVAIKRYLSTCVGSVIVARKGDQVQGYAALDKREEHHFLAPLYADDKEVAKALMGRLLEDVPAQESIAFDMSRENEEAHKLREELGVNQVLFGDITPMFTRERYASRVDKIYSTISPGILLV